MGDADLASAESSRLWHICFYAFVAGSSDAAGDSGYRVNRILYRKVYQRYGYRHREEEAEYQKTMSYIDDRARDYAAAKDIRLFGLRPWFEEIYEKALNAYAAFHKRSARVYIWGNIADLVLAFIRNGAAYAYLIARVLNDGLDASQFLLYFSAVGGFSGWVSGLLGGFSALHRQSLTSPLSENVSNIRSRFVLRAGNRSFLNAERLTKSGLKM